MSEIETVAASLTIEMNVTCPNPDCGDYIDLLRSEYTNGVDHNEDGDLLRQMLPENHSNEDFECDDVICTKCKTMFNVRELEW